MPFEVPLCGSGSEYPRDVVDVVLLAIKELAPKIDTDIFLEVSFFFCFFVFLLLLLLLF